MATIPDRPRHTGNMDRRANIVDPHKRRAAEDRDGDTGERSFQSIVDRHIEHVPDKSLARWPHQQRER